jgi:hypothetical protein
MFFKAKLDCGVEVLINPAHVSAVRFTPTGVLVEFPSGRTIQFPSAEEDKIRQGLMDLAVAGN